MKPFQRKTLSFFKDAHQGIDRSDIEILDVGVGHGGVMIALAEMGYQTKGCDLYPEVAINKGLDCKKVDLNNETMPYDDNSFDFIIFNEIIQYVENPRIVFEEFSRIIRPGGQLLLTMPNILHIQSRIKFMLNGYTDFFKPFHDLPSDPYKIQLLGTNPVSYVEIQYLLDRFDWDLKDLSISQEKGKIKLFFPWALPIWLLAKLENFFASPQKRAIKSRLNSWTMLFGQGILIRAQKKA